jgi:hypothetical protein
VPQGGKEARAPFSAWGHVELLGGVLYLGLQRQWPTAGCAPESGAWVALFGRETQTAEAVGDELEGPKANGFIGGEATVGQAFTIGGDDEW